MFCFNLYFIPLFLLALASGNNGNAFNDVGKNRKRQYDAFLVYHGKSYLTEEEYEMRFEIFNLNMILLKKWNENSDGINKAVFGLNYFSDMTHEEYKSLI
jgi:hypothetical protein